MRILLVGAPNCGKTTLFNALTGARERTGNREGVTVSVREKRIKRSGDVLVDLPGLAFWDTEAKDGRLARQAIQESNADVLLLVVDAVSPERGLSLLEVLRASGLPIVVALNRMDVLHRKGHSVNLGTLSKKLGVRTVGVSAIRKQGLKTLLEAVRSEKPSLGAGCKTCPDAVTCAVRASFSGTASPPNKAERRGMHPLLSVPLSLLLLAGLFCLTFDWLGPRLTEWTETLVQNRIFVPVSAWASTLPSWLDSLITEGLLSGLLGVIGFLPQLGLLFLWMTLLEESGILSRMAFVFDWCFHRIGLDGKALIPLLLGFGCTVTAALSTRSLSHSSDRDRTIEALPFLPCAAKLPLLLLVTETVFPNRSGTVLAVLYTGCVSIAVLSLLPRRKRTKRTVLFALEPLTVPNGKAVFYGVVHKVGHFVKKVALLLLVFHGIVWALLHLNASFRFTDVETESLLYRFGTFLGQAFPFDAAHAGGLTVSLLVGFFAKEATASTLLSLSAAGICTLETLSVPTAWAFLILFLGMPPCMMACLALRGEHSCGMVRRFFLQTAVAFLLAGAVYHLLRGISCI